MAKSLFLCFKHTEKEGPMENMFMKMVDLKGNRPIEINTQDNPETSRAAARFEHTMRVSLI